MSSSNIKTNRVVLISGVFSVVCFCLPAKAQVNVNLTVYGCNNNNICEPNLTEDYGTCPNDCNPCNHNNICEVLKGESYGTCPSDCPPPVVSPTPTPTVSSVGGGSSSLSGSSGKSVQYSQIKISNVKVEAKTLSATISWDTSVPSFGQVQWGSSAEYSAGSIDRIGVSATHSVDIEDLFSNKTYYFRITSSLPGVSEARYEGSFTTSTIKDIVPPANVSSLIATADGEDIVLSWLNPKDADLAGIKVLRSPYFYPEDPNDGKLIYEGKGTYVRDPKIDLNKVFYYSVFSYDANGNYSSGALVNVSRSFPTAGNSSNIVGALDLKDFIFIQNNIELPIYNGKVRLYPFYDTDISIPKSLLSDAVDFLMLRIADPNNSGSAFSYKLTPSADGKYFSTRMGVISTEAEYPFALEMIGFDNKNLGEIQGTLDVKAVQAEPSVLALWMYAIILAAIVAVIAAIGMVHKRRSESH